MAEYIGRDVELLIDGSTVMCFRTLTPSVNGEPLDITDGCSNGFRTLARVPGQKQLDLAVEGIAKGRFLRALAFNGEFYLENVTIRFPPIEGGSEGDELVGDFVMADFSENTVYNEMTTFSATLQSSGPWTYTEEA